MDNRVRHILEHKKKGFLTIVDPIGYKESNFEIARNTQQFGIVTSFSSNIKFVKDGLEFIRDVKDNYGINEIIKLHREVKHPQTDIWEKESISVLDLTTYSLQNNELSIKVNSGEVAKALKARQSEKLEIESLTSVDGAVLSPLETHNLEITGRELKLKSLLECENLAINLNPQINLAGVNSGTAGDSESKWTKTVPISIVYKSDEDIHEPIDTSINDYIQNGFQGTAGMMFYVNESEEKDIQVSIDITFRPIVGIDNTSAINDFLSDFRISLAPFSGETYDFNSNDEVIVYHQQNTHVGYSGSTITRQIPLTTINVSEGDSLALVFSSRFINDGSFVSGFSFDIENISASLVIEEDSSFENTNTKMVLLHDLGKRLVHQMIGKNRFKSSILGRISDGYANDGQYSLIGAYCGHWLRGFDSLPDNEENKYKPFTTSFKDFTQTLRSVFNISTGIETINGQDYIVCEDMSYFFNPNIVINLPKQISNVKRYTANNFIYSGVEIGYEKGGEYEEVFGLDEPNGKANFTTCISAVDSVYEQLSKYRADVYGEELARRKQRKSFPNEDTPFDKDIFIKDLKEDNGVLSERMDNDDFSTVTGIFSPSTAKNLRLSPIRNLLRHGKDIGIAMKQYQDKKLKFGSSTGNSNMITQLTTESQAISERGDILNEHLGKARFSLEYIDFDYPVTFDVIQQLKGKTNFSGRDIPNFYCKVQFINEEGKREFGYIMSVKTSSSKWKLLKA